jgi:hypothetical protein
MDDYLPGRVAFEARGAPRLWLQLGPYLLVVGVLFSAFSSRIRLMNELNRDRPSMPVFSFVKRRSAVPIGTSRALVHWLHSATNMEVTSCFGTALPKLASDRGEAYAD